MKKNVTIKASPKAQKKLVATFTRADGTTKTTHFGSAGMDDYTRTKDKEQRARYIARHKKRENWSDPESAGALSRYILWGDSTSQRTNIASFKRRFGYS